MIRVFRSVCVIGLLALASGCSAGSADDAEDSADELSISDTAAADRLTQIMNGDGIDRAVELDRYQGWRVCAVPPQNDDPLDMRIDSSDVREIIAFSPDRGAVFYLDTKGGGVAAAGASDDDIASSLTALSSALAGGAPPADETTLVPESVHPLGLGGAALSAARTELAAAFKALSGDAVKSAVTQTTKAAVATAKRATQTADELASKLEKEAKSLTVKSSRANITGTIDADLKSLGNVDWNAFGAKLSAKDPNVQIFYGKDGAQKFLASRDRSQVALGVTGFSGQWAPEKLAADPALAAQYARVRTGLVDYIRTRAFGSTISGGTALGVPNALHEASADAGVKTFAIMSGKAAEYDVAKVQGAVVVGKDWGAETETFLTASDELLGIGGGGQAKKELLQALAMGKTVTVVTEFGGGAAAVAELVQKAFAGSSATVELEGIRITAQQAQNLRAFPTMDALLGSP